MLTWMEAGGRQAKGEQVSGIRRKCRRSPPKIDRFLFSPATTCDMSDVVISMDHGHGEHQRGLAKKKLQVEVQSKDRYYRQEVAI